MNKFEEAIKLANSDPLRLRATKSGIFRAAAVKFIEKNKIKTKWEKYYPH